MSEVTEKDVDRLGKRSTITKQLSIQFPRNTPIFILLLFLAFLLILWAFFGRIPTEISGQGVTMNTAGNFVITSSAPGTVTQIFVNEGDMVKKGAQLGIVDNPEIKSTLVLIEALDFKIEQQKQELFLLESAYQTNLELFKEGLVAKLIMDDSQTKVYEKQIQIDQTISDRDKEIARLNTLSSAPKEVLSSVTDLLLHTQEKVDYEKVSHQLSTIISAGEGRVLEVLVNVGDRVDRKQPLFWVEYPSIDAESEVFYGTVSSQAIGQIEVGNRVLIEPLTVNPQEYGSIIGKVSRVYPYPVSEEELTQTIGNKQIVKFLIGDTPAKTLIVVTPEINPQNPSGYQWTSEKGPPFRIPTGTVSNIKLVIDEQPPISYLIPLWKIKKPLQQLTKAPSEGAQS